MTLLNVAKAVTVNLCLQSTGNKNGKLWSLDDEVSPEVLAKVRRCTWSAV